MAQCSHVVKGARKVEVKGSLHDKNQLDRPGRFSSCVAQGCICQISLGGVEVLAIEVDDRANA